MPVFDRILQLYVCFDSMPMQAVTTLKTSPHNNVSLFFFLLCQDFLYHGIAAFFYLSASVALAKVTLDLSGKQSNNTTTGPRNYKLDVSAVVSQAVVTWVTQRNEWL